MAFDSYLISQRRPVLIFTTLFLILALPMAINGYPLVMEDTAAYAGYTLDYTQRPLLPALWMGAGYSLVGFWALPIFNCALNAFAWVMLIRSYELKVPVFVLFGLIVLSLQPLYTSAGLVDAWFFPAVVFTLVGALKKKIIWIVFSGLLLSSHGSGVYLFLPMAVIVLLVMRDKLLAGGFLLAVIISFCTQLALTQIYQDGEPLMSEAFLAGRFISAEPRLLMEYAETVEDEGIQAASEFVTDFDTETSASVYGITVWEIWRGTSGKFNLKEFQDNHAGTLIVNGITDYPVEIIGAILKDWASFYVGGTHLDFISKLNDATMEETLPEAYYSSLQWQGFWIDKKTGAAITIMRITLYAVLMLIILRYYRALAKHSIALIVCLFLLILGNDLFFAIVSGHPDRYHHRSLVFFAVICALVISAMADAERTISVRPD